MSNYELLPCPLCGGEAVLVENEPTEGFCVVECTYCAAHGPMTNRESAIKLWNTRAEREAATLGGGKLTAEQVRDAIERHVEFYGGGDYDEQAIAATLGSGTKPCYAANENYKRCKYGVNRGWCDDAPFLVWDDTGHLFITMGGLKTWDVTDDAKKWFAEQAIADELNAALGNGECETCHGESDLSEWVCSECQCWVPLGLTPENIGRASEWRYCPHCGRKVKAVENG